MYKIAGCAINTPKVSANNPLKKSGVNLFLLNVVIPFIKALSIVRIIKPINIPKPVKTKALLIMVEKKYVHASVANSQVVSTLMPIILKRLRSITLSIINSFSAVDNHHNNLENCDGTLFSLCEIETFVADMVMNYVFEKLYNKNIAPIVSIEKLKFTAKAVDKESGTLSYTNIFIN